MQTRAFRDAGYRGKAADRRRPPDRGPPDRRREPWPDKAEDARWQGGRQQQPERRESWQGRPGPASWQQQQQQQSPQPWPEKAEDSRWRGDRQPPASRQPLRESWQGRPGPASQQQQRQRPWTDHSQPQNGQQRTWSEPRQQYAQPGTRQQADQPQQPWSDWPSSQPAAPSIELQGEALYGVSTITAALAAGRRSLHTLYVQEGGALTKASSRLHTVRHLTT